MQVKFPATLEEATYCFPRKGDQRSPGKKVTVKRRALLQDFAQNLAVPRVDKAHGEERHSKC